MTKPSHLGHKATWILVYHSRIVRLSIDLFGLLVIYMPLYTSREHLISSHLLADISRVSLSLFTRPRITSDSHAPRFTASRAVTSSVWEVVSRNCSGLLYSSFYLVKPYPRPVSGTVRIQYLPCGTSTAGLAGREQGFTRQRGEHGRPPGRCFIHWF